MSTEQQPQSQPPATPQPATPQPVTPSWSGLLDSDTNKLIAIIGGAILVAVMLGGAAVVGALVTGHGSGFEGPRLSERHAPFGGHRGFGDEGPFGRRGGPDKSGPELRGPEQRGEPGSGAEDGGMGMLRGLPGIQSFDHGDLVVTGPDGAPVTMRVVRGEVTASSETSISVSAADGYVGTFAVNAQTETRRAGQQGSVAIGDRVLVIGSVSGESATAAHIIVIP